LLQTPNKQSAELQHKHIDLAERIQKNNCDVVFLHVKRYDLMLTIVLMISGSGNKTSGVSKIINKRHQRLISDF